MTAPATTVLRPYSLVLVLPQGQEPPVPRRTGEQAPDPAQPGTQAPAGPGPAADPMACLGQAWPLLLIFVVMYFLILRPQQKQEKVRKAMLAAIKEGDEVVTTGGIWGKVSSFGEDTVSLRIDDKVKITVDRGSIGRVVDREAAKKKA